MSELQIEEGKWYRTRGGDIVGPMAWSGSERYPWVADGVPFRHNGRWCGDGTDDSDDLVEEVPAPQAIHMISRLLDDVEEVPATLPQNPVEKYLPSVMTAADLRSEIDRLQSEVDARTCGVKTRPYRVPPSGKDDVEEASADTLPRRAVDIAGKAASLVGGDRDRQHGAKHDNFRRIAGVWNAWLAIRKEPAAPLDAHDVGCMMALMKLARTQSGALNVDDYVDACGYAACAGEVAQINET